MTSADRKQQAEALARVVHEAIQAERLSTGPMAAWRSHEPFDRLTAEERALYERIAGAVAARIIREQMVPLRERVAQLEEKLDERSVVR